MAQNRIQEEKETIEMMIHIYCKWNMATEDTICTGCRDLLEYAFDRLNRCPFGENKPSCRRCSIHCYKPEMKKRIREVMRFAGPKMFFYHPVEAVKHLIRDARKPKPLP